MDSEPKKRVSPLTLVLIVIIVLLAVAAVVLAMGRFGGDEEPETENLGDAQTPLIGYEEGVTAIDEESLQKAVEEMRSQAARGGVPVEYQNDAYSSDGKTVDCYIANPTDAPLDIYIQIFADPAFEEEVYLSKLIPPGKALQEISLSQVLEPGTHRVFVVYSQVEDDHMTIFQQVTVTMDFHVNEE